MMKSSFLAMDAWCDLFLVVCRILYANVVGATSSDGFLVRIVAVMADQISWYGGKTYALL